MKGNTHPVIRSGVLLGLIALLGTALLASVNALTADRIAEQEKRRVLQQLNAVLPEGTYNNALLLDRIEVTDERHFRHAAPVIVYRARLDNQPVGVLMITTAPDGYNGDIRLLTGIGVGGVILGVRVLSHRETPGLGDPIEIEKSDWILGFTHKSLSNPQDEGWAVKRDGGEFDQFTGATISPKSVVKAVHRALLYYQANQQTLFSRASIPAESHE